MLPLEKSFSWRKTASYISKTSLALFGVSTNKVLDGLVLYTAKHTQKIVMSATMQLR